MQGGLHSSLSLSRSWWSFVSEIFSLALRRCSDEECASVPLFLKHRHRMDNSPKELNHLIFSRAPFIMYALRLSGWN